MPGYSDYTVLNTGDHVLILAFQLTTPSYLQLVDPGSGNLQVYAAASKVPEPYSAKYNLFVVVQAPGWSPSNQVVYLLSPWFGYLQVVAPGSHGMPYRVSPTGVFGTPSLGAWNTFLASWTQSESQGVVWNFGFTNPSDKSAQLLQLVDPSGAGTLILEPITTSSPSTYSNFQLIALAEGTGYPPD